MKQSVVVRVSPEFKVYLERMQLDLNAALVRARAPKKPLRSLSLADVSTLVTHYKPIVKVGLEK